MVPMPDIRWLSAAATADYVSVREVELRRLTKAGVLPTPSRQLGPKQPRWDRLEVDARMIGVGASSSILEAARQVVQDILVGFKPPYRSASLVAVPLTMTWMEAASELRVTEGWLRGRIGDLPGFPRPHPLLDIFFTEAVQAWVRQAFGLDGSTAASGDAEPAGAP